ncbi:Phosphatidylinositol 3-kinase piki-1 [Dirofilaria immitis]
MSNVDLQERLARHRGFTTKAREVLLEPPAPFAVVAESSGSLSNESVNPKSPHRGFTAKAREMLVERQGQDTHHSLKSFIEAIRTDFDTYHKQQSHSNHLTLDDLPIQQANIVYEKKEISIPHSKLSRIKAHKLLGETGKTRSANEIFYDKCMKRVRSPLLRCDLQVASSSYGIPTTTCPDSQQCSASEKTNELRDA